MPVGAVQTPYKLAFLSREALALDTEQWRRRVLILSLSVTALRSKLWLLICVMIAGTLEIEA